MRIEDYLQETIPQTIDALHKINTDESFRMTAALIMGTELINAAVKEEKVSMFVILKISIDIGQERGISNIELVQYFFDNYTGEQIMAMFETFAEGAAAAGVSSDVNLMTDEEIEAYRSR